VALGAIHIVPIAIYYLDMRRKALGKPWKLNLDEGYLPTVTLIVATYNEANTILNKMKNIAELDYPTDKLDVIIVDSASTDGTPRIMKEYLQSDNPPFKIFFLEESQREGKAKALNHALQQASGSIVATSDADCIWTRDSLKKALKYLSDDTIAAVCSQEVLINPNESSATRTESQHRQFFTMIRLGESKKHSTIVFEGALALYKRKLLQRFDESCDDSGSALDLVQQGYRTILVPDAFFLNPFPSKWTAKISKKTRRAQHLVELWWKCFRLSIRRKLKLDPWISAANVFLYLINPFFFALFLGVIALDLVIYPILLLLLLLLPIVLIVPKMRDSLVLYLTNHLFLLYAIFMESSGRKQVVWKK
jgi:biofilm PGA synthesis N-glycosyltransferase PgaC